MHANIELTAAANKIASVYGFGSKCEHVARTEMDWRMDDLRLFVAVVDEGSLAAAARRLSVPRPSVSRRLSALERDAGVELIWRNTRHLRPTEIGLAFYERCRRLLEEIDDAEALLAHATAEPTGTLRISAPPIVGPALLARTIDRYLAAHPHVTAELELVARHVDLKADGYDLLVRLGDSIDDSLVARRVGTVQRIVCGAPSLIDAVGEPQTPHDLEGKPGLQFSICKHNDLHLERDGRSVDVAIRPRLRTNDYAALRDAAIAGHGFAPLPTTFVEADIAAGRLRHVLSGWSAGQSAIHVVYAAGPFLPPKVSAFLRILRSENGLDERWRAA